MSHVSVIRLLLLFIFFILGSQPRLFAQKKKLEMVTGVVNTV